MRSTNRTAADARLVANAKRRVERARNFPFNTCPASRHLHIIALAIAAGKPYAMLQEEPQHCALTMLSVIESLWKARTELLTYRPDPVTAALLPQED